MLLQISGDAEVFPSLIAALFKVSDSSFASLVHYSFSNAKNFAQKVKDDHHLYLEVVKRKQSKGFQVLSWRWIVERTLVWLVRHRQLTIDYEALPATSEAFIHAAMFASCLGG